MLALSLVLAACGPKQSAPPPAPETPPQGTTETPAPNTPAAPAEKKPAVGGEINLRLNQDP